MQLCDTCSIFLKTCLVLCVRIDLFVVDFLYVCFVFSKCIQHWARKKNKNIRSVNPRWDGYNLIFALSEHWNFLGTKKTPQLTFYFQHQTLKKTNTQKTQFEWVHMCMSIRASRMLVSVFVGPFQTRFCAYSKRTDA